MTGALQMLLGSGGGIVSPIPFIDVNDDELFPTDALGSFSFLPTGGISVLGNGSITNGGWYSPLNPAGVSANYWIRVTKLSGINNNIGDALGVWIDLSATRTWTWTETGNGTRSATLKIEIAADALGAVIVSSLNLMAVHVASVP